MGKRPDPGVLSEGIRSNGHGSGDKHKASATYDANVDQGFKHLQSQLYNANCGIYNSEVVAASAMSLALYG
jgi:hypothetical protein